VIMPGIRPSDKESVNAVVGAMNEAPFSQLVVPRIFMKQAREDRGCHIRTNAIVGKRGSIAFAVGVPPLSPSLWIILCLCDRREDTVERICPPIKNAGGCQSELLASLERWQFVGVFDGPVVRQDLEDAIIDGSRLSLELALPYRRALFVFFLAVFCISCLRSGRCWRGLLGLWLLRRRGRSSD